MTNRNHCPYCLSSQHLDNEPGDRAAACGGVMKPISVWVRKNGEWAIIHRCRVCGVLSSNRGEAIIVERTISEPCEIISSGINFLSLSHKD